MPESSDRLDRVEALLARVAESNAASAERLDRIEAGLASIEAGLASTEQLVAQNAAGLRETRAIADSNARAIQAWDARITEGDQRTQTQLEASIADTVAMIADMGRQQQETDQRFEVFLAEARADREEMRAAREQWQLEAQANATEHRAFTQNVQVLLAEIARLWQRIAG